MRKKIRTMAALALLAACTTAPLAAQDGWDGPPPWQAAGLSERQAAVHLLERFTFGPRPGDVDRVLEAGLWSWIEGQLAGDLPGAAAADALTRLDAVALEHSRMVRTYQKPSYIVEDAIAEGVIDRDDYQGRHGRARQREARDALARYSEEHGFRPSHRLIEDLRAQKLYRALYAESQLVEVLTDFWFNHFNVSVGSSKSAPHLLAFERDAVRPHVLGPFRDLLGAAARHPAMLRYLDNAISKAPARARTALDDAMEMRADDFSPGSNPSAHERLARALGWQDPRLPSKRRATSDAGLNENYARELLELHTLGVDGGYTQRDVVEVARAFTGWTSFAPGPAGTRLRRLLASEAAEELGFVVDGEFLFRPDHHDSGVKQVRGVELPAGRGVEDGEEVLDLLAREASTAWHLSLKLATRFVADDPPRAVVERLAATWELTGGDLRETMRTLVRSPELWTARADKVKSPFVLATSALRALDAEVSDPSAVVAWIARLGQPLYAYAAPTGYPDRAAAWTAVGAMRARLDFAFELTLGKIDGVTFDLLALAADGERRVELPSRDAALAAYFPLLLPERGPHVPEAWLAGEPEGGEPSAPKDPRQLEKQALRHAGYAVGVLLASPDFQLQ